MLARDLGRAQQAFVKSKEGRENDQVDLAFVAKSSKVRQSILISVEVTSMT